MARYTRDDNQRGLQTCKYCVHCLAWWPITEFYTDRAKADGLRAYCKKCDIRKAQGKPTEPAATALIEADETRRLLARVSRCLPRYGNAARASRVTLLNVVEAVRSLTGDYQ